MSRASSTLPEHQVMIQCEVRATRLYGLLRKIGINKPKPFAYTLPAGNSANLKEYNNSQLADLQ